VGRLHDSGLELSQGDRRSRVLVPTRQVEQQVADRDEPELLEPLRLTRADARDALQREVEVEWHMPGGHERNDLRAHNCSIVAGQPD
jgi:hypothetical protein